MQIVSSYGVEIKKKNIPLRSTLDIFRKAVSYLIPVYAETWEELSELRNPQKRFNEAEHLVHETKKNHARFPFDRYFPKMPSYLRRAAIQHALGAVSSSQTRLGLWEKGIRPNFGKETSYIFSSIFVHRGSKLIENSGKSAGDMQC